MTAAALRRRAPGPQAHDTAPSFLLALTMHGVLLAWMWIAVQWHTSATAPVVAELWDLPAPQEPAPEPAPVVEAPPPPPPSEAPAPPKPDIVEHEEAPKRQETAPPVEAPPVKKSKPAPPKPNPQDVRRQQVLAAKQHEEEMRRLTAQASTTGQPALSSSGPVSNEWMALVQSAVRAHLAYAVPEGVGPDVCAIFAVELLPTGEQAAEPQLVKPSGLAGYDEAAQRAIIRTDPFPRKEDGTVPRHVNLKLCPQQVR